MDFILSLSHLHKEDGDAEEKRGDPGAQDDLARLANGAGVLGPHRVHDCVVPAKSDNSNHSCSDRKEVDLSGPRRNNNAPPSGNKVVHVILLFIFFVQCGYVSLMWAADLQPAESGVYCCVRRLHCSRMPPKNCSCLFL
jgi:hypothetical protein